LVELLKHYFTIADGEDARVIQSKVTGAMLALDEMLKDAVPPLLWLLDALAILLAVNYRPEYQHGWTRKTYYRQLRVDPLPPESAEALLTTLLGDDPSVASMRRLLIARTEGNPLFLEETVRALVETRTLLGERGDYRLAKPAETIQVPATVQAILAVRIDR